jgi:hypothetical protein
MKAGGCAIWDREDTLVRVYIFEEVRFRSFFFF